MIKVKEKNQKSIEILQLVSSNTKRESEITLEFPKTLDFKASLSSTEFFEQCVEQKKSLFKSKNPSLTLLYAKYLDKKEMPKEQLRTSLSLFSYQFLQTMKDYELKIKKDPSHENISTLLSEVQKTLNSFRGFEVSDDDMKGLYSKIDYLLSFEVEQYVLKMIKILKEQSDSEAMIESLMMFTEQENKYRRENNYNKKDFYGNLKMIQEESENKEKTKNDNYLRIVNKMEMHKKLIELPLKVSEKVFTFGKKEKYWALGISSGIIMLGFSSLIFQARLLGLDTTINFVLGLAALYVFRDLFREEIKNYIYDKITSIKPLVKSLIYVPDEEDSVGITKTWFSRNHEVSINNTTYKDQVSLTLKEFLKLNEFDHYGFKRMKTLTTIDLSPIMSHINRDDKKILIYGDENSVVEELQLPRQYKLKLKIKEKSKKRSLFLIEKGAEKETIKEYRIIINRNEIISIEKKSN